MQFLRPQLSVERETEGSSLSAPIHNNRFKHYSLKQQRELLPIFAHRRTVLFAVEKYQTVILTGETGCGKSTQLPLYLHEAGWTQQGFSVACTQPKRIAATAVASRVADELGCALGEEVGFDVRFERRCGPRTKIKFCTDSVLMRETLHDPLLSQYSVVIVDDAHQRSLHSDVLLGLLKKIQRHRREDFRVVVASASLDVDAFKLFFETNTRGDRSQDTAAVLALQGRLHAVDLLYLQQPCRDYLQQTASTVFRIHEDEDFGDVLVFLPGSEEIEQCMQMLGERCQEEIAREQTMSKTQRRGHSYANIFFLPLHAGLPMHQQVQVFEPTPPHMRKVILATNIAEASITIEGVRFVVDCGFVKLNYFDVRSGIDALLTMPVSKAAAAQRAGRAGRVQPGKCFRLMTEDDFDRLEPRTLAEMQRVDISWAVLQLKALGVHDVLRFDFMSPPSADSMIYALELLYNLGALDDNGLATKVGLQLAEMPVEPRVAKCLLSSFDHGCTEEMISIAAMCSVEYPFISIKHKGSSSADARAKLEQDMKHFRYIGSDHLTLLNIFREFQRSGCSQSWCDSMSLQFRTLSRAKEIRHNLATMLKRWHKEGESVFASAGEDDKAVRRCLIAGFFAHVARLHSDGVFRTLRGQVPVKPYPTSVLEKYGTPPEWVLFNDIVHSKATYMREVTSIEPLWLYDVAPHYYSLKF